MKISLSSVFLLTSLAVVGCSAQAGDDASSSEADVTAPSSAYTSLEAKDCQDQGQRCAGMPGYELIVQADDSRNNVVVKAGNKSMDLDVWSRLPAFSHLGPKAEWRGPVVSPGVVNPYALIFRFFQTDGEGREKNYLVVSRVSKDASCIVDAIDGGLANANVRAREIADGAKNFQCPGAGPAEPPPNATSIFTSLGDCPMIASGEEGSWANFACTGTDGYTIERQSGDARENVVVKHGGAEADLELWSIGNGSFSGLGPTADWRVHGPDKKVHALVFRFFQQIDDTGAESNWLIVAKISGNTACVYDVIDAKKHPNANVLAHVAADASFSGSCPAQIPNAH